MTAVQKDQQVAIQQPDASSLMKIIDRAAMDPAFDVAKLQALLAVKKEWEADEAHKAYVAAVTLFKANPPEVLKDKANHQYKSRYTSIGEWVGKVTPALSAVGLTARWDIDQSAPAIKVTCILTHSMKHSESATMSGPPDESGAKNPLQEIKSTVTYLEIATFQAVTGLASSDGALDDDGNLGKGVHQMDENEKIAHLEAVAKAADSKALESLWAGIASECTKLGDIPAYEELKSVVRDRVKALKKENTI